MSSTQHTTRIMLSELPSQEKEKLSHYIHYMTDDEIGELFLAIA